jgi:hypothetical protein
MTSSSSSSEQLLHKFMMFASKFRIVVKLDIASAHKLPRRDFPAQPKLAGNLTMLLT